MFQIGVGLVSQCFSQDTQLQIFELANVTCPRYVLIIPDSWAKRLWAAARTSPREAKEAAEALLDSVKGPNAASWVSGISSWVTDTSESDAWEGIAGFCAPLLAKDSYRLYLLCESCGCIQRDDIHNGYKLTHVKEWVAKLQPALKVSAGLAASQNYHAPCHSCWSCAGPCGRYCSNMQSA